MILIPAEFEVLGIRAEFIGIYQFWYFAPIRDMNHLLYGV